MVAGIILGLFIGTTFGVVLMGTLLRSAATHARARGAAGSCGMSSASLIDATTLPPIGDFGASMPAAPVSAQS